MTDAAPERIGEAAKAESRFREFLAAWGDLPSIAPHPEAAPGLTTGRVLHALSQSADALTTAQARIAELEAAQAEALDRAQVWLDAAMARKKFTSDCLDQYGEKMGEAEYAANLNVHDSCMDRIAIIQALFPDLANRALEAKP